MSSLIKNSTKSKDLLIRSLSLLVIVAITFLSSCRDEILEEKKTGKEVVLTINIPTGDNLSFISTHENGYSKTRADFPSTIAENQIKDLYVVIFNAYNVRSIFPLSQAIGSPTDTGMAYNILVANGNYTIYVLANLDTYISGGVNSLTTKYSIENSTLNFSGQTNRQVLEPGKLPMAWMIEDINISNNNVTLNAELKFICSKVRYTLLFDRTDFSEGFLNAEMDFKLPSLQNIPNESRLFSSLNNVGVRALNPVDLNPVRYPDFGSEYLDGLKTGPEDLPILTEGETWAPSKRSWQGILYLPENLSNTNTAVTFNLSLEGYSYDKTYTLTFNNLEKGEMYDYAIKMIGIDRLDFISSFDQDLKVGEWEDSDQTIVEW